MLVFVSRCLGHATLFGNPLRALTLLAVVFPVGLLVSPCHARPVSPWFENFKSDATDAELYTFLYAMPKGGDLHNHLSGAAFPRWWYELALAQQQNGYRYFTKTRINNCRDYGTHEFGRDPYLLMFVNLQESNYKQLSECEQSEFKPLDELTEAEKAGWLNSLKLDKAHEGRDEFFQTHWQRMNDLFLNHRIQAEILVRNMVAFGNEGLRYLEIDMTPVGIKPDGSFFSSEQVYQYYEQRLQQEDAQASGVTVRFHYALLRFAPNAEEELENMYRFVHAHRERYVAIDMVGREDNDKGYPLRFLSTLRDMRSRYPGVQLSIHAGEVDEPNHHIRDTLLLGANRIGHGLNLLGDPDTLLLMRHGPYLVEINLVSNLLLEYVEDYSEHPFPELLRIDVPVALSTDDRGMWSSNLTDEFFVAVKEFNLSWEELKQLNRNSLAFGFMDEQTKQTLLSDFAARTEKFEQQMQKNPRQALQGVKPVSHAFTCRQYRFCEFKHSD